MRHWHIVKQVVKTAEKQIWCLGSAQTQFVVVSFKKFRQNILQLLGVDNKKIPCCYCEGICPYTTVCCHCIFLCVTHHTCEAEAATLASMCNYQVYSF